MTGRASLYLGSVLLAVIGALPASAQQAALTRSEQNLVNFGFATQLGSGVYVVSGRTMQIYRLPFGYTLKSTEESNFGVELTLPVTLGFYDFKLQDAAEAKLPNHIDALSFVPGVTFSFVVLPSWQLQPFIEAGISQAGDAHADAWVYAGGLRSLYTFGGGGFDYLLRNEIVYAGLSARGTVGSDDFARLQNTLTARRPFTRQSKGDYLMYVMQEFYVDEPRAAVDSAQQRGSSVQYEIGVTFGTTETRHIWRIPLPRVGIGYRFGEHLDVFRLVIGSPF